MLFISSQGLGASIKTCEKKQQGSNKRLNVNMLNYKEL